MKTLLLWMVCIHMLFTPSKSEEAYVFNRGGELSEKLTLDWEHHKAIVTIDDKNTTLDNISKDCVFAWNEEGKVDVIFKDFNFDGYTDIAITFSLGDMGYNGCYDYYFYDLKDKKFHKSIAHISNLEIVKKEHILRAYWKDGLAYFYKYYQIDTEGKPFLFLRAKNHISEKGLSSIVYESLAVKVKVKRTYFYDECDGDRLNRYLIKGDRVQVLDMESTIDGKYCIKVSYQGKKKIYRGLIKLSDLVFEPMPNINIVK